MPTEWPRPPHLASSLSAKFQSSSSDMAKPRIRNVFADTAQTQRFWQTRRVSSKSLIWLAPRAGFEPATIRLTVECSTAELPRNRRTWFANGGAYNKASTRCKGPNAAFERRVKRGRKETVPQGFLGVLTLAKARSSSP